MTWPQDPTPWAEAPHPAAYLQALYSPDVPNREHSHEDFRTVDDPTRLHRAGVRWTEPVALTGVRLRWRKGFRPQQLVVVIETPDGPVPHALTPEADTVVVPLALQATGVALEQPPGAGPTGAPGVMRISALALQVPDSPRLLVTLTRDGAEHVPHMPLATDGSPHTFLDASDALALQASGPWQRIEGVSLTLRRVGSAGAPESLRRWLARPGPILWVDERVVPCTRRLDAAHAGVVAGTCVVAFVPERPTFGRRVRIALPDAPHALAIEHLEWRAHRGGERIEQISAPPPLPAEPPDPRTLAEAARLTRPLRHAASLGLPGGNTRVGVLPDGGWVLPQGTHARVVHAALTLDGQRLAAPTTRRWCVPAPTLECGCVHGAHTVTWRAWVEPGALVIEVEASAAEKESESGGLPRLSAAEAEPVAGGIIGLATAECEGFARWGAEQHQILGPAPRTVRLPLEGTGTATPVLAGRLTPTGAFAPLLDALLLQASLFVQEGPRVAYGLVPSVYANDVFGLEEDYLFRGLAYWGAGETALAAFRTTYLTATHLDARHFLHDLRTGLTPWQLEHLLRLTGRGFDTLSEAERGLVEGLGRRIQEARRLTAHETGERTPGGWRVFPGLLPPFRFGGDLDFPTQSLYVNAIAWCGLRSAARLLGWDVQADLADYQASIFNAFDVMATEVGGQPLHSGGDDPADYYQLMACGLLDPVDFFPPGDPRAARIDEQVAQEGRLFCHLPRFDGWGGGQSIDAVYCHGYLQNALRQGRRSVFRAGLLALLTAAMDREVFTFREVGPIQLTEEDAGHWLPGRRLSRSEPCVGSLGVALQLIRNALVCELPDPDGGLGRRLLVAGGVLPEWWQAPFEVRGLPTLAGPVDVIWHPAAGLRVYAPGAEGVDWVDADDRVHTLAPEAFGRPV